MTIFVNYAKAVAAQAWIRLFGERGEFAILKEKTAIVIEDVLPKEVCLKLMAQIDAVVDNPAHPRVWRDDVGSDSRILGFEHEIGDLVRHFDIEKRMKAVAEYTGRRERSWFLMANRVIPKENNLGSGGGMHRDSPFSNQVKCIWYLNDVAEDNGPFQYIHGTHVNQLKSRDLYPLGKSRFDGMKEKYAEVHAKAGSLLVCDTKCIHGGKPITKGVRYAVTLYTLPKVEGAADVFRKSSIDPRLAVRISVERK